MGQRRKAHRRVAPPGRRRPQHDVDRARPRRHRPSRLGHRPRARRRGEGRGGGGGECAGGVGGECAQPYGGGVARGGGRFRRYGPDAAAKTITKNEYPIVIRCMKLRMSFRVRRNSEQRCLLEKQIAPPARRLWKGALAPFQSRSGQSAYPNHLEFGPPTIARTSSSGQSAYPNHLESV